MEARLVQAAILVAAVSSLGAGYRTQHFLVTAPNQQLATEIGQAAEKYRRELAIQWLGHELPPWQDVCPISAQVAPHLGAGGVTKFTFIGNTPRSWSMAVQGTRQRVLDSVLPHEITHTIFATHFGRPLPRWADEGACTTVEHSSERGKQHHLLIRFLTSKPSRGIAFNRMFALKEYPADVLPLYSQGFSVTRFLIAQGGRKKFIQFLGEGMKTNNWNAAVRAHYGIKHLSDLQISWLQWVKLGSPSGSVDPAALLAQRNGVAPVANQIARADTAGRSNANVAFNDDAGPPLASPIDKDAPNQIASAATDGWYNRQRDRRANGGRDHPLPLSGDAIAGRSRGQYAPGSTKAAAPITILSRPQPTGRPKQRVLEWHGGSPPRKSPPLRLPMSPVSNQRGVAQ